MPEQLICPQCGAANPPGSQFCANCGWAPTQPDQQPQHGYNQPGYGQQQPYAQQLSYAPSVPYDEPRRDRRLIFVIASAAVAVALVATLAIIFVPRVLHRPAPVPAPPPVPTPTTMSQSPQPTPSAVTPSPKPSPTPPPPDYKKLGPQVSSGILKVVASGCSNGGSRIGSAFLISKTTAVASLSSLAGVGVIGLSNGHDTFAASVSAADPAHGVVILKLDRSARGHVFAVDNTSYATHDPVGTYAVSAHGTKPSLIHSKITATGAATTIAGTRVGGLSATSARVDAGSSGAPTLAADGHANGMVLLDSSDKMLIVSGTTIKETLNAHRSLPAAHCSTILGPGVSPIAGSSSGSVKSLFTRYFGGINSGNYRTAYGQLSRQLRSTGYHDYAKGWATSYDFNIVVHKASSSGAHVTFDSIFAKGKGPKPTLTCARWNIDYQFVNENGGPVINRAAPHSGSIWRKC